MHFTKGSRFVAAAVMPLAVAGGLTVLAQGSASAAGKGATTQTFHVHGTTALGAEVVTFIPPGPTLPAGCWLNGALDAFVSTSGNGVFHLTQNKTGAWFTTTYTGTGVVLPILFATGEPVRSPTGTVEVTLGAAPLASGHLRVWFGTEDNNKSAVRHATVTFKGALANGTPVSLNGHFDVTTNAHGTVTASPEGISCT